MKERLEHIDALRGFSLLGILLANMLYFQFGDVMEAAIKPETALDRAAYYFTKIAVEGSFYPIFGFLFGYGVILFVRSLERKELRTKGPLLRRSLGLIIMGLLHMTFVWDGDILLAYGVALFIFLTFLKRQPKTLVNVSVFLLVVSVLFSGILNKLLNSMEEDLEASRIILSTGTYLDVLHHRTMDLFGVSIIFMVIVLLLTMGVIAFFAVGPFILFGLAAGKINLLSNVEDKQRLLRKVVLLLPIGLLMKCTFFFDNIVAQIIYYAGTYILAVGYIAAFLLVFQRALMGEWRARFASVGKLSLTNYLLQSIVWTTIFYGYGFGLFGQLGVALGVVCAVIFYAVQVLLSNLYLKRFSIGPIEWLLRKFVYLR